MSSEKANLYRAEKLDNLLIFEARYHRFQFDHHAHEEFSLGLMEEGVQKYHCRSMENCAPGGSLITVNPDEIHDGMSADKSEYRYRVLFVPYDLLQNIGSELVAAKSSHYFRLPVTEDPELADRLGYLFHLLEQDPMDLLEAQSVFYQLIARFLAHHGTERERLPNAVPIPEHISRACEYIQDTAKENISVDDIAAAAGLSRYHFLRVFAATKGISPHAFLLHRRLQLAKESIRKNTALPDAAFAAGFADQIHMSRRFKSAYGITPKQYQKAVC